MRTAGSALTLNAACSTLFPLATISAQAVGFETAIFPAGWEGRQLRMPFGTPPVTVICPELHDLAASKLAAGRDKDFDYVSVLIAHDFVDTQRLLRRIARLESAEETRERLRAWVGAVAARLSG